jgi:hypothetical protein
MIIENEKDLNLELFFNNVGTWVNTSRNMDKIQAFLETYRNLKTWEPTNSFSLISFSFIGFKLEVQFENISIFGFLVKGPSKHD